MLTPKLLYGTLVKCCCIALAWMMFIPPIALKAQLGLAGRNTLDFRLNQLRAEVMTPHGQQPPYEWSAAYLRNPASNIQPQSNFVLDSSVCGYGVVNTNQFGQEFKVYYSYDNDGQLSEMVFRQEGSPGVYENYSRKSYSYTGGKKTAYLYQRWAGGPFGFVDDYEEITTYNTSGKQTSFTIAGLDSSGQWKNFLREKRNYDMVGNPVEVLYAKWENNAWLDTARKEIEYNSIGFYTTLHAESWNGSGWDTLSRETAAYGSLGMIWEGYLFEKKTPNGFEGVVRESYQYDDFGFWVGMVRQLWDTVGSKWNNSLRETYQYNNSGIWTSWGLEVFKDTGWVSHSRQFYSLTPPIRQDIMQLWDTTAGVWENRFRVLTRFDSARNLVQEAGIQAWNENASAWRNTNLSRMCEHFWSPVSTTSIHPQQSELNCSLPNPYRVYDPIHCEALQPGKSYNIRLMDMQGRTVYQKNVSGGELFAIEQNLPVGIYCLSIYEDQQARFIRKILINH